MPAQVFQTGHEVTHISGVWGDSTEIVERVNSDEDPMVYFVRGGFWRSSRLRLVVSQDAPPFDPEELS